MPRLYEPQITREYEYCDDPTYYAEMKESKFGTWVKLRTYKDVIAQKDSQIMKLRKEIELLKSGE